MSNVELPEVGRTYRRKRDGAIVLVEGFETSWVVYRHGVTGEGRRNSVMAENFFTKYEPWPCDAS